MIRVPFDIRLFLVIVLINVFGLVMIYSASYYYAMNNMHKAPNYLFLRQLVFVIAGFFMMLLVSCIRPKLYRHRGFWIIAAVMSIGLCLAVKSPIGHTSHGASRWIIFMGQQIQVAEPIKVFVVVAVAGFLAWIPKKVGRKNAVDHRFVFWGLAGYASILFILIYKLTNNFSTAIIIFLMIYLLVYVNKKNSNWMLYFLVGGILLVVIGCFAFAKFVPYQETEGFRFSRIRAWVNPTDERFAVGEAYQATMGMYAIAHGGIFGRGLGQSLLKFKLPEPHNDYILTIIFEELGVVGVLLLSILFLYMFYRIFRIYRKLKEPVARNITLGVLLHLMLQTVLNYCVATGVIPTMGVTLPFISYGGTAAAFTLVELGFVFAAQRDLVDTENRQFAHQKAMEHDPEYARIYTDVEARKERIRKKEELAEKKAKEERKKERLRRKKRRAQARRRGY